mgnify:CR=1 FL=1
MALLTIVLPGSASTVALKVSVAGFLMEKELRAWGFSTRVVKKVKTAESAVESAFLKANTTEQLLFIEADEEAFPPARDRSGRVELRVGRGRDDRRLRWRSFDDRHGRGGRNTEFLLATALALQGVPAWAIACDTDGIDGSEDNAGAVISPDTLLRARERGLDAAHFLAAHDSHGFFAALGDLVVTGPTRTNVNDYRALLLGLD